MYHCFRLHRGDDLYESIQHYADAHHIAAGVVLSAVGCVYRWELRDASGVDVQSGTEDVEIVSLMGTVSEHGSHLHASLARRDLSVFGGHLRIAKSGREKEKNLVNLNNSRKRERKRLLCGRFLLSPFRAR